MLLRLVKDSESVEDLITWKPEKKKAFYLIYVSIVNIFLKCHLRFFDFKIKFLEESLDIAVIKKIESLIPFMFC